MIDYDNMIKEEYKYSERTGKIIGCAIEVHKQLGNGFQEVIYPSYRTIVSCGFKTNPAAATDSVCLKDTPSLSPNYRKFVTCGFLEIILSSYCRKSDGQAKGWRLVFLSNEKI